MPVALLFLLLALVPIGAVQAADQSYPQNYKTELRATRPAVPGLKIETAGGDRFLVLSNGSGKTVIVNGYDDDPYLRFKPNRVVEVNLHSPSKYVNEDRFGTLQPPASATPGATPKWKVVSTGGTYKWFDHRIHWMDKAPPSQIKDKGKRTKIFDWDIPIQVQGKPVHLLGTLSWVPDSSSGSSTGLIVGLVGAALALAVTAFVALRRRGRKTGTAPREKAVKEAW